MDRVDFTLDKKNLGGVDHYALRLGLINDPFYLDNTSRIMQAWDRKPTTDELWDVLRLFMRVTESVCDSAYLNREAREIVWMFSHKPYFVHYGGREYTEDEVNNGVLNANL